MLPPIPWKYALPLFGLATSAFVFNTSEFMPIGLLSDIAASFAMTPAQTGIMITVYAWMVGLLSLPLMLVACRMELRRLLLLTICLFMLGQLGSAFAVNFPMLMGARIAVACAHSIFWSIAGPLATRLVTQVRQPFALSMIATGSSIAMIFGLPLGRAIGLAVGWRMTFAVVGGLSAIAVVYQAAVFPAMPAGERFTVKQLPELLKNPLLIALYAVTVFMATGYYASYSYIEPFVQTVAGLSGNFATVLLLILGGAGIIGSILFGKLGNQHASGLISLAIALLLACLVRTHAQANTLGPLCNLLMAALGGSLAGDVFLMFPGFFIPGLVSFLVAHLFYVALFKSGQAWFPHRGALAATLGIGVAMYAFLWTGGLPPALRAPVAAYVLVIALMAAQAIGRATVLRDAPSVMVAVGAGFFMLSDSLLATNRFVTPLPMAQVWVLATYYAAQALIVAGTVRGAARAEPGSAAALTPQTDLARSPSAA